MGIKTETFYDQGRGRRRLVYLLCGLVVAGCAAAVLLLAGGGGEEAGETGATAAEETAGTRTASPAREGTHRAAPDETGAESATPGTTPGRPEEADPETEELRAAEQLHEDAMVKLRASMEAEPGTDEAHRLKKEALAALLEAQEAYERFLEKYPHRERRLSRKLADLQSNIYWCRKGMAATDFKTTGASSSREPRDPLAEPPRPLSERTPRVTQPVFRPSREASNFLSAARKALKEGRPGELVKLGKPLVEDPRMQGHLGDIPAMVALAERMEEYLAAARATLAARAGQEMELEFRSRTATGLLEFEKGRFRLGGEDFDVSELSHRQLRVLAEAGEWTWNPARHYAVGAYLFRRGEQIQGVADLLRAQAGGEDVSYYEKWMEQVLKVQPELRALKAYLDVLPVLEAGGPKAIEAVRQLKTDYRASKWFEENRESLFRVAAAAAAARPFEVAMLYGGESKLSGKSARIAYDFSDTAQLEDLGVWGKWTIEEGELRGTSGSAWVERFYPKDIDFRFVLREAAPLSAGIWDRDGWGRGANVVLKPGPAGLEIFLQDGSRTFAKETIRAPSGELEFVLQKRGDKFQLRLNRKLVVKGQRRARKSEDLPVGVGFTVRGGANVAVEEMEVKGHLDTEWAEAGGTKYAAWLDDWHVCPSIPLTSKDLKQELSVEQWVEREQLDLSATTDDGKAVWTLHQIQRTKLDLNRWVKPSDRVVAYAVARVWSPKKMTAVLEVEVDDLAKVWVNGELVVKEVALGDCARETVKLVEGENLVLVKALEATGGYWIRARFLTKSGGPLPELQTW